MSTLAPSPAPPDIRTPTPLRTDDSRGRNAMRCVIASEFALFVVLFFSYYYLRTSIRWEVQRPPELIYPLVMLGVLLVSTAILQIGDSRVGHHKYAGVRAYLGGVILLGILFLVLQYFEARDHLKILTPQSDAYGSVFYAILGFHAAHLTMGILMLIYVLMLPRPAHADKSPYQPYHVVAMYWKFVNFIWFWVVVLLYIAPRFQH